MLLFFFIALSALVGLFVGRAKQNKKLFYFSFIVLLVDITLFAILSILYAIYE